MTMRVFIVVFCALCLMVFFQPQAKADVCGSISGNLVLNCGFETGDFTSWNLSGNDVPISEGVLYGVETIDPFPLPGGTNPNSGMFQAFFSDQAADPTTLSQTLTTVAGHQYTISFYLAQQLIGPGTVNNDVLVSFGGSTVENLSDVGVQGYTHYTATVDATSASTTFNIKLGNDVGEFLLDDVSVVASPEPATLPVLVGFVLLAAFFVRRRGAAASR